MVWNAVLRLAAAMAVMLASAAAYARSDGAAPQYVATYQPFGNGESIQWGTICFTEGYFCDGGGTLTPFGHVCAMLQGKPDVTGDTTKTILYVMDGGGSPTSTVTLDLFLRTDTIADLFPTNLTITTMIALLKSVPLPLLGGPTATCFMAANEKLIFAGTSQPSNAVGIERSALYGPSPGVIIIGSPLSPLPVTSITADFAGYVTVNTGTGDEANFYLYGPAGTVLIQGGGSPFVPNALTGVSLN